MLVINLFEWLLYTFKNKTVITYESSFKQKCLILYQHMFYYFMNNELIVKFISFFFLYGYQNMLSCTWKMSVNIDCCIIISDLIPYFTKYRFHFFFINLWRDCINLHSRGWQTVHMQGLQFHNFHIYYLCRCWVHEMSRC